MEHSVGLHAFQRPLPGLRVETWGTQIVQLLEILFARIFGLDAALFGQERHRTHEVLNADDAYDFSAFGDGDEGEAVAGGDAADGGAEGVLRAGNLEGSRHDGLDVAVALIAQGFDDPLSRDDAHELRSADDGKVLL